MLPVTLTFSILLEEDLMRIISQRFIHSQPGFRFQVSIAFLRTSPLISESTAARLSFQISLLFSDFRVGVGAKSKSGVRFQISDFRLARGGEIEIGSSISDFRFQTRTRERNRNREFHFNFGFRLQSRLSGETKSNLEMNSRFHFDFSTELLMTQLSGRALKRRSECAGRLLPGSVVPCTADMLGGLSSGSTSKLAQRSFLSAVTYAHVPTCHFATAVLPRACKS